MGKDKDDAKCTVMRGEKKRVGHTVRIRGDGP